MRLKGTTIRLLVLLVCFWVAGGLESSAWAEGKMQGLSAEAAVKPREALTRALRAYVAASLQIDETAVVVRVLSPLEGAPGPLDADSIRHVGAGKPVGRVVFLVGSVRLTAEVDAFKEVLVASRYLRRNHVLEEGDCALHSIRLAGPEARYLEDARVVVGKRLTRPVMTRLPITEDVLAPPYVVRQGERITIQYLHGLLSILAVGIAKEDGHIGASIRVTNTDSKKELWGKVVDAGTVQAGP